MLDPRLEASVVGFLEVLSWVIYGVFVVDLLFRLVLAELTWAYMRAHWYDGVLIILPMLRSLRLLRLLAFARLMNRAAVGPLAGRVSVYVTGSAIMAILLGTLAILDVERDAPGGNIETAGDALWWAITTVTSVGYGDHYPVTATGRFIASLLMLVGIIVVGALTAVLASWLMRRAEEGK